ncbi:NUDIX hydrolase [Glycomyces albus]
MITNTEIAQTTRDYLDRHPGEKASLGPLIEALDTPEPLATRTRLAGHVTCGAVVIDDQGRVLHVWHRGLDRLLLPGGHTEKSDTSLIGAALRELAEETGLTADHVAATGEGPIHIDLHTIPDSPTKGEPEHWHADFRYAFTVTEDSEFTLQTEEVTDAIWAPTDQIANRTLRACLDEQA